MQKFPVSDNYVGRSQDLLLGYITVMRLVLLRNLELYPILRIVQIIWDSKHLSSWITENIRDLSWPGGLNTNMSRSQQHHNICFKYLGSEIRANGQYLLGNCFVCQMFLFLTLLLSKYEYVLQLQIAGKKKKVGQMLISGCEDITVNWFIKGEGGLLLGSANQLVQCNCYIFLHL